MRGPLKLLKLPRYSFVPFELASHHVLPILWMFLASDVYMSQ